MLSRIEVDVVTERRTVIRQTVYKKGDEILVLDDGKEPPEGYEKADTQMEAK